MSLLLSHERERERERGLRGLRSALCARARAQRQRLDLYLYIMYMYDVQVDYRCTRASLAPFVPFVLPVPVCTMYVYKVQGTMHDVHNNSHNNTAIVGLLGSTSYLAL